MSVKKCTSCPDSLSQLNSHMENHTWDDINQLVQFGNILDSKIPLIACKLDSAYYLPSIVWFLILGNKFPMLLIGQTKTLAWFWTFRLKFRCVKLIRHWSNFAFPWNSFTQFSQLFSNWTSMWSCYIAILHMLSQISRFIGKQISLFPNVTVMKCLIICYIDGVDC